MDNNIQVIITEKNNIAVTVNEKFSAQVVYQAGGIIKESFLIDRFITDSQITTFNLSFKFRKNSLWVFYEGILQEQAIDYIEAEDRRSFTFLEAIKPNRKMEARYVLD